MDTDFNEATAYKLQADNANIELAEVTDEIDGDEYTYTELSIPMPQMNTAELTEWIGTDRSRNGLHGEPVVSQAQETLEELVGYRLGKRKRRPRRPEGCFGGSRHRARYPDNSRCVFSIQFTALLDISPISRGGLNEVWLGLATGILRRLTELLADGCLSACVLQGL